MTVYSREDAKMTQGFAVLCMCMLHLFCRVGSNVLGTPLLWLSSEKPFVYWIGFFSEVCVPIFTICAGYARQLQIRNSYQASLKHVFKLLKNYWIVVVVFSAAGLLAGGTMPGNITSFLKAIFLIQHYNGAQWYINTYIILSLIPAGIMLFPVKRMNVLAGIAGCFALQIVWYLAQRFGIVSGSTNPAILNFCCTELKNLAGVLPYYWMGAFICKGNWMETAEKKLSQRVTGKQKNLILFLVGTVLFIGYNLLHKAVLVGMVSLAVFFLFNLWQKGNVCRKFWGFLGKHSTNIWLTHMFFYCSDPFEGLVQKAQYPVCMLIFMLVLCIMSSYIIMMITKGMNQIQRSIVH